MGAVVVIDVGNTSTGLALWQRGRVSGVTHIDGGIRNREAAERAVRRLCRNGHPAGAVLGSVVPTVNAAWCGLLDELTGRPPLVVGHRLELGVTLRYPAPGTIGADRLADACGAVARYGAPVIVADFGTALTFDVITPDAAYIGGVIAPGLPLMTDYLADRTALLPHIRLKGPCGAIGRSTVGAMRLGAQVGYRGMVREITRHLLDTLGWRRVTLCATGGYAPWALAGLDLPFKIDPTLTLYGLGKIHDLNR